MAGYEQASDDLFGDGMGDLFDDDGTDFFDNNAVGFDGVFEDEPMADIPLPATPADNGEDDEVANALKAAGVDSLDALMGDAHSRPLELGEKADDAIDYEDFDDDELPDEEEATGETTQNAYGPVYDSQDVAGDIDEDEDLFGASSPLAGNDDVDKQSYIAAPTPIAAADAVGTPGVAGEDGDQDENRSLASEHDGESGNQISALLNADVESGEDFRLFMLQRALFEGINQPETEEENNAEWARLEFPDYNDHEIPYFNRLFPPQPVPYRDEKAAKKPPKPTRPGKVNLDVQVDERLLFNAVGATSQTEAAQKLVSIRKPKQSRDSDDSSQDSEDDESMPGGYTMQDLEFLCADFDTLSHADGSEDGFGGLQVRIHDSEVTDFDDFEHTHKKQKTGISAHDLVSIHQIDIGSLDHPERKVARVAKKTVLDFNDPNLLIEEIDPETVKQKAKAGVQDRASQTVSGRLASRFQTSNDNEYEKLGGGNKTGQRDLLGNTAVEHSMPALRLQYPYFPVQLSVPELRNWHRKKIHFKAPFTFAKPNKLKRKNLKSKSAKEVYVSTKELSMGDNSTAVLFEYSEEHPLMLSSTGMGNNVVTYYRKKDQDDSYRPKHPIGEPTVLLSEDGSPFSIFGHVDPGREVTALLNSMYKAPLFKQPLKQEDFLVVRETTGLEGQRYYIRNVDSSYVVGQEFPVKKIPGIHSRNVTTASKNRLRAIAYRLARRKKNNRIRVEDVTRHFPDSTDMQNRQKMKEFMSYNKEHKEWEMAKGHAMHTEDQIQDLLKPEDIAILEAKDVGAQYLRDVGFADDDAGDDDEDRAGEPFEQAMAPWKITKNFVQANDSKAMLKLYGDGDPSGRGEAISFLKINMKGGFQSKGGAINDTLPTKEKSGGHNYNVAKQDADYKEALRHIWKKQSSALSSLEPPTDPALEGDIDTREDNRMRQNNRAGSISTPGPSRRIDDETGTSFSRRSVASQQGQRFLKITRKVFIDGVEQEQNFVERDQDIIKAYLKRKEQVANANIDITKIGAPTGDAETDARNQERLQAELLRLEANQARNKKRATKKKAADGVNGDGDDAMSPSGDGTPGGKEVKPTVRRCANCGQVGHIKTNKKLCPLLNGTLKQEEITKNTAFMGGAPPPSATLG